MSTDKIVEKISTDGLQSKYKITFPASLIEETVIAAAREKAKTVKMPGFRPGKVSLPIVRSKFKDEINRSAVEFLVSNTCNQIIKENNITELALRPSYVFDNENNQFEEGNDISVIVTLDAVPTFDLKPYDFEITKIVPNITDTEVEETRKKIMENNPAYTNIKDDRGIQVNDRVHYVASYFHKGVADSSKDVDSFILIPENNNNDQFIQSLIGKKVNDSFDFTIPNNKKILYKVTIKEIQVQDPNIDPAQYATATGFKSLDEFNGAIKKQIENNINSQAYLYHKSQIIEALVKEYNFDLPKSVVEQEKKGILRQIRNEREKAQAKGEKIDTKTDQELMEEYGDTVNKRVLLGYVFSKIAKQEGIEATDDELNNVILNEINSRPELGNRIVEYYRNNPGALNYRRAEITEQKVVNFLISKVKTKEELKTEKEVNELVTALLEEDDNNEDINNKEEVLVNDTASK
ncbi:MAG: trigger factor [Alphaproteobacteria bacterium]|nr:trigger factor [Alphaproteobacteria bacterium]